MSTRFVIVAGGDATASEIQTAVGADAATRPTLIAADGGALLIEAAGLVPDLVLGDGDSLSAGDLARLRAAGVAVRLSSPEKDESDTELCLVEAIGQGASSIALLGALGGPRPEHTVANLQLLAHPMLDGLDVRLVAGSSVMRRIGSARDGGGHLDIRGTAGDWVSLVPMDPAVDGVTTVGLRYPLVDEPLTLGPTRGLSNELLGAAASVITRRGRLLVIHTAKDA